MPNGNQVNWQDLGWQGTGSQVGGLEDFLGQFFATEDIPEYMQTFQKAGLAEYDPAKEQMATQQMQLGQQGAQEDARGSLWKMFQQGRQGGTGFGGAGRARQTAMGGIHKGLAQGREQAQLGLQEKTGALREDYREDIMSLIGDIQAAGVEGASDQQACEGRGGKWLAEKSICDENYNEPDKLTDLGPISFEQENCEAKGFDWENGICQPPVGSKPGDFQSCPEGQVLINGICQISMGRGGP